MSRKKVSRRIINFVLIIGLILLLTGIYQLGTISFLSTHLKDIENTWVPAINNQSRGYYGDYNANDTVNIIGKISYSETIDSMINNPYELFVENVSYRFQEVQLKGLGYLYFFENSTEILISNSYFPYEEEFFYEIKLHDWFLADKNYWVWTLESKGASSSSVLIYSLPLILVGLVILIFGGVALRTISYHE